MKIAFYKGTKTFHPVTWLIRKITSSQYSHVAIVFSDGRIAEATGKPVRASLGVRWSPLRYDGSEEFHQNWDLISVPATQQQEEQIAAFVDARVGEPFSWRGLFSFIAPWLVGRLEQVTDGWICTTFSMAAMRSAGLLLDVPMYVCPRDIMRDLQARSQTPVLTPSFGTASQKAPAMAGSYSLPLAA